MTLVHPDVAAPKAATRALIDACGGSDACSALLDGKSRSLIDSYANPNRPDRFMPLDDIWRLERFCGRAIVSDSGSRRAADSPSRIRRSPEPADIARVGKELSDVVAAKAAAWADNHFCEADRRAVARELREAACVLLDMIDSVEAGA